MLLFLSIHTHSVLTQPSIKINWQLWISWSTDNSTYTWTLEYETRTVLGQNSYITKYFYLIAFNMIDVLWLLKQQRLLMSVNILCKIKTHPVLG